MLSTIFTGIPTGVSVRKLDTSRRAQGQKKPYAFSAWRNDKPGVAYGNSIRDAIKKLNLDVTVHMH